MYKSVCTDCGEREDSYIGCIDCGQAICLWCVYDEGICFSCYMKKENRKRKPKKNYDLED